MVVELGSVIAAIVEVSAAPVLETVKRSEPVVGLLVRFGLDPGSPPPDFDSVYVYTLVQYGVGKPKPILDFFRDELIRNAFRQSFEERDASILHNEAESLIEWHKVGEEFRKMDVDPRREFARFTAVFNQVVGWTRTPAEVRRDHKLDDIYRGLHESTGEIVELLGKLNTLDEIREELVRL
ncbi:MAG: hypothetical protein PVI07_15970, partial [Anaerolineae bacterium]